MKRNWRTICRRLVPAAVPLALLLVGPVVAAMRSLSDVQRMPRPAVVFDIEAAGTHAVPDREWSVVLEPGHEVGLAGGAAVCGDQVFLLDHAFKMIHRVSLASGDEVSRIGDAQVFEFPYAIAAACDAHQLFVSDYSGLIVIDTDSEQVDAHFPKPAAFSNSLGTLAVDAETHRVFVPGVWAAKPKDWVFNGLQRMFAGAWLGREIDVRTGETLPLVPTIEQGCFTASPSCLTVSLDSVPASPELAWIAAQKISTRVGLFDRHHRLVRTVDVRSRKFQEDGRRVSRRTRLEAEAAWHEHNSVIHAVSAFRDGFAVVHTIHRTKQWRLGGQTDFDVFVNVYGYDGRPLVSDVRLPDLPVAHDAHNLYTVSYGAAGRRKTGDGRLVIARFAIQSLMSGAAPIARAER